MPAIAYITRHTGRAPFNRSPARVKAPSVAPATRLTFVAPIFLLPFCLISIEANLLVKIRPHGMDPSKYAKTESPKSIRISKYIFFMIKLFKV